MTLHPLIRVKPVVLTFFLILGTTASAHDATHGPQAKSAAQEKAASEAPYLAQNNAAMTKMMNDMAIKPTGDVDRDFVDMMVPHHQGAIDMAEAILRYGHNEKLKRLAQEIIVTQQQEIAAMRLAVGEKLPPSIPSPTQISPAPSSMSHGAMPQK
jgi:hypothetical protein